MCSFSRGAPGSFGSFPNCSNSGFSELWGRIFWKKLAYFQAEWVRLLQSLHRPTPWLQPEGAICTSPYTSLLDLISLLDLPWRHSKAKEEAGMRGEITLLGWKEPACCRVDKMSHASPLTFLCSILEASPVLNNDSWHLQSIYYMLGAVLGTWHMLLYNNY